MSQDEVHAVTWEQVRFVVFELNGNVRFINQSLRASFGERVECANREAHLPLWEFAQLQKRNSSLAYRLLKMVRT